MLCAVCQKKTETTCGQCKYVHYCSRDCQKSDWKSHKKFCGSFTIKKEEEEKDGLTLTRHSIVAAKDLERGDRILEELPLFQISQIPFLEQAKPQRGKKDYLLCVSCGNNVVGLPSKRCSRCKWPVCAESGKNCEKHKIHAENECEILASRKIIYDSLPVHEDRRILLILRAGAVKEKKPEVWNELMKRADEISKTGRDSVFNREEISKLEETMKKLGIPKEEQGAFKKLCNLLNLTSILHDHQTLVVAADGNKRVQPLIASFLYPLFNYFSYSCAPNCNFAIEDSPTYKIHVRAARDIKKGEELTILSGILTGFEGTIERRLSIKNQFGFFCKCKRCCDSTEFGTFFSGIVCNDCRPRGENKNEGEQVEENVGYFLPLDPESESESKGEEEDEEKDSSTLVQCNGCKITRPYSSFEEQLSIIRGELDDDYMDYYILCDHSKTGAYTELEADKVKKYLSKYSGKILHPNHFLIHKALCHLSTIYGLVFTFKDLTAEGKVKHKSMYEQCVHFARVRLELETRLLDGALMDDQARDQSCIALGLLNLARIQMPTLFENLENPMEVLEMMKKLKGCVKAYEITIDFYTKYMPTTFKSSVDLEQVKQAKVQADEIFRRFNKLFNSF